VQVWQPLRWHTTVRRPLRARPLRPSGQPFQALQTQIDILDVEVTRLSEQVIDLQWGEFSRLGVNDAPNPSEIVFGPEELGDLCRIGIDPSVPGREGLIILDPQGMRVLNPLEGGANQIFFGEGPLCSIGAFGNLPAVAEDTGGAEAVERPAGLFLQDPNGIRLLNPNQEGPVSLFWGPTDDCSIVAGVPDSKFGLLLTDPRGFLFDTPLGGDALVAVNGTLEAQEIVQTSSRQMKQDVVSIEDALERIGKLQGVYFDWKPEYGGKADVGFIAEQVAEVLPEAVAAGGDDSALRGVKYGNIVAVAVEGIKAQQHQIEALHRENRDLRQTLAELQEQVAHLAAERARM
jgi:hypothetical protein